MPIATLCTIYYRYLACQLHDYIHFLLILDYYTQLTGSIKTMCTIR